MRQRNGLGVSTEGEALGPNSATRSSDNPCKTG
jgi:hypothetical protein